MGIIDLLVYVDDIVVTGFDYILLDKLLKLHLSKSFNMKDLGFLTYFVGALNIETRVVDSDLESIVPINKRTYQIRREISENQTENTKK